MVKAPDVTAPAVRTALAALRRDALASGVVREPVQTFVNPDHTVARVAIPLAGDGENAVSVHALGLLRDRVIPASLGGVPGVETAVTGETAGTHDFNQTNNAHAPIVFSFVLGLAFLLLLIMFRSIVVAATAIVLNLLSVGAAYGVLVWIFQDGHLQSLLGFHSTGAIVTWLPLFLFTVLFGLSMDYHVFIVSRIKELRDGGMPTREAVARGIHSTAATVTSAAAVMVAVFSIFASLSTIDIKQLGVGLAVADAEPGQWPSMRRLPGRQLLPTGSRADCARGFLRMRGRRCGSRIDAPLVFEPQERGSDGTDYRSIGGRG